MDNLIKSLEEKIKNPIEGLPKEVFLFASRITPMINVDLLIKDENNKTLLSWRNDEYHEKGWHVIGGIIRYKEKIEDRIKKTALKEIGTAVKYSKEPIAINQLILRQENRGHFISMLYDCFLTSKYDLDKINKNLKEKDNGYLMWHEKCPKELIRIHDIYRNFIGEYK